MDTLIQEVELLAKEKEAEANGDAAKAPSHEGWEALPAPDQTSTRGKEIPVLSNKS
jgi:(E)-4-hydroxy-3-methylbut-2-enyl-diphosphate synthase